MNNSNYIEQKKNIHLCFEIGGSKYAINSSNVLEILKLPKLDYPQKLPNNIIGLLKYNNFVINIVDIRFYLQIAVTPYTAQSELLIVKTDETIFGIITDKVYGILPFESSMIDTIPFTDKKMIIDTLYKYNQETVFIVNVFSIEKLLKEHNEWQECDIPSLFPKDKISEEILNKRAIEISDKSKFKIASSELQTKNKYISFNLNKDLYCISLNNVTEVLKDTSITRVPGTPDFIEGIMNLRGDYITVINLNKFFELNASKISDKNPVIIIENNEFKVAFLIDKINELFELQDKNIVENSEGYFSGEFIHNDALYTILNIDKIISDKRIIVTDI